MTATIIRKPLLVGEDNPHGSEPEFALYPAPEGCAGQRLAKLIIGAPTKMAYLEAFDRVNLCSKRWTIEEARRTVNSIMHERRERIVILGAKVCSAFALAFKPFESKVLLRDDGDPVTVIILPHPSGRNRMWNDPGAVDRARRALRQAGVIPEEWGAMA